MVGLRRLTLAAAIVSAAWAALIARTGGFVLQTEWLRLSSRDPERPLVVAAAAVLVYVACWRHHWRDDAVSIGGIPASPRAIAALLTFAALLIGIQWGSFVAAGSDASGYVSQAEMWVRGELTFAAPAWAHDAPWDEAAWTSAPLGYRPSETSTILVPTYAPGLPMMMALFQAVGGRDAVYYVVPLLGALAVWATYLVGARIAGGWAGVLGAALLLSSPTFLLLLVQPMSDVPVAAFFALAIWGALRAGPAAAFLAGTATALGVVTRPNLAPLGAIVAFLVLVRPDGRRRDLALFAAALVPAAVAVAVLNTFWYGSPLVSGYGPLSAIYAGERLWPNLQRYVGWFAATQPFIFLAVGAPFAVIRAGGHRPAVWLATAAFPAAVLALYLPYFVFEEWWYLRFLLPAFPVLLAGVGAVIVIAAGRPARRTLAVLAGAFVLAAHAWYGWEYARHAFALARHDQRYLRVARFAAERPPHAVFVSLNHSGAIRYYGARDVLRWEILRPESIDTAISHLRQRGHEVYLTADHGELQAFRDRFAASATVQSLDRTAPTDLGEALIFALR